MTCNVQGWAELSRWSSSKQGLIALNHGLRLRRLGRPWTIMILVEVAQALQLASQVVDPPADRRKSFEDFVGGFRRPFERRRDVSSVFAGGVRPGGVGLVGSRS